MISLSLGPSIRLRPAWTVFFARFGPAMPLVVPFPPSSGEEMLTYRVSATPGLARAGLPARERRIAHSKRSETRRRYIMHPHSRNIA
jgi:hypothetical protein